MKMKQHKSPSIEVSSEQPAERSRRDVLKTGAMAIPTIVTLYSAPAWAGGSDKYTRVAYRYGINAGKCRNPNFDPSSNEDWQDQEFMHCDEIRRRRRRGRNRDETQSEGESGDTEGRPKDILEL